MKTEPPALPSGGTLPTTTTRQEITIPLDGLEGTLVQVEIAPNAGATLRLYGGFLRYRVVGVFLRSSMGEKWVSLPMGLAS